MDATEKQLDSLRCLWASRTSLEVIGWLRHSEQFKNLEIENGAVNDKLLTIRSFLVQPSVLTPQQIEYYIS